MKEQLKKLSWLTLILLAFASLTACNTVEGAGKDIEAAGEEIQDAADGDD